MTDEKQITAPMMVGILSIFLGACAVIPPSGGDVIRVYSESNLSEALADLNAQCAGTVRFRQARSEGDSDVTVSIGPVNYPGATAVSYVYSGHIDVLPGLPREILTGVLFHEFLHCAGEAHSGNHGSTMNPQSDFSRGFTAEEKQQLRRLAGMNPVQRLGAQVRALL